MKVENFYNKNQFIIRGENQIVFQSYDSEIAIIENRQLTLGLDWDYSKTTLKHLYLFLNDFINLLNIDLQDDILKALQSSNTKKALQKLIDNKRIVYNEYLK